MSGYFNPSRKSMKLAYATAIGLAATMAVADPIPSNQQTDAPIQPPTAANVTTSYTQLNETFSIDEREIVHLEKRGLSEPFLIVSWDPALDLKCFDNQGALWWAQAGKN
jgi:hypothetical protein